jgi:hypothetical protein
VFGGKSLALPMLQSSTSDLMGRSMEVGDTAHCPGSSRQDLPGRKSSLGMNFLG